MVGDIEELASAPQEGERAKLLQAHVQLVAKASAQWDGPAAGSGGAAAAAGGGTLPG